MVSAPKDTEWDDTEELKLTKTHSRLFRPHYSDSDVRRIEEAICGLFTIESKYQAVAKSNPDYSDQSSQVRRPQNCSDDDFEIMVDYLKEIGKD